MSHDGDAADAALLAAGEHARLLAKYEPVILGRCIARLKGHPDVEDVAQDAKLRLWRELQAGKKVPGARPGGKVVRCKARLIGDPGGPGRSLGATCLSEDVATGTTPVRGHPVAGLRSLCMAFSPAVGRRSRRCAVAAH